MEKVFCSGDLNGSKIIFLFASDYYFFSLLLADFSILLFQLFSKFFQYSIEVVEGLKSEFAKCVMRLTRVTGFGKRERNFVLCVRVKKEQKMKNS